jgi:hypothetical protein
MSWRSPRLDQGRVILAITEAAGGVSPDGDITEAAARDLKTSDAIRPRCPQAASSDDEARAGR